MGRLDGKVVEFQDQVFVHFMLAKRAGKKEIQSRGAFCQSTVKKNVNWLLSFSENTLRSYEVKSDSEITHVRTRLVRERRKS